MIRLIKYLLIPILISTLFPAFLVQAETEVFIGVLANRGEQQALTKWAATADYLSEKVPGHGFTMVPLDFSEVHSAVLEKKIDFILVNPGFYVELEHRYGVSRILTIRNLDSQHGHTQFGGVIFTRSERKDINELVDLVGQRFSAVHETSLGGFQMAWRELHDVNIDPFSDFASLTFAGTHDAVVYSVLNGLADAGTVRTDTLERMAAEGKIKLDEFRIINPQKHADFDHLCSTRLYPEWPLAKLPHTPENLSHAVATALLGMPADSAAAILGNVAGWTVPRNYQPVHELMRELKIGPYTDLGKVTFESLLRNYWHWLLLTISILLSLALLNSYLGYLNRRLRRAEVDLRSARDNLADKVHERTAELELAMSSLAESHHRLEMISQDWNDAFDAIQDPIFIHDEEMRIIQANPAYFQRAGKPAEQVLGKPYYEVFPLRDKPLSSCLDFPEQVHAEGEELLLPSGEVFVSRSFGIRRADGSIKHAIHILEDVSDIRRAENRRRILSQAVEQASEGVLILNAEKNIVYVNPSLCDLLSCIHSDIEGACIEKLVSKEFISRMQHVLDTSDGDQSHSEEIELLAVNGEHVPVYLSASTIHDEQETVTGYVITIVDLSEIKNAEAELTYRIGFESVLAAIASRFVTTDASSLDHEINKALQSLGEFAGVDRAYLFDYDADLGTISNTHEWCAEGISLQRERVQNIPFETGFPWLSRRMLKDEAVHIPNILVLPEEAAHEKAEFLAQSIKSLVLAPISYAGKFAGFIGFDNVRTQRVWVEEDIRLLKAAGEVIVNAIGRINALTDVQRSEASLAEAQQIAHLGNWEWDIENNILLWSDEIYRIFGLKSQQFGASYDAFIASVHPDDRQYVQDEVNKALQGKNEYSINHRIIQPDGTQRTVHEMGRVFFDAHDKPVRMIGTVQDVTELHEAELELQRLNRALRTLSAGNTTLVHAVDEQRLLQDICKVLIETGGYRFAWVGYAQDDENKTVHPMAYAGYEEGYLQVANVTWGDDEYGHGPTGSAIRTGKTFIARDIATEPSFGPWREEAMKRGYASVIALPLESGSRQFGALTIDSMESEAFDPHEVTLLKELANDLAFGIRTLRNRAERDHAVAALEVSEQRYHDLYESAPNAYVSVSAADGSLMQYNSALIEILGYSREQLATMKVFELYADTPDGLAKAKQLFAEFRTGNSVRDVELQMRHCNGQPVWISLSVDPVFDDKGQVVESRSSVIDISKRKQAEEDQHRIAEQLQRSLVQAIRAISITIEKRDPYTHGHQERVAQLAVAIGQKMGLDDFRLEGLRLGALIHDIGKIYVPTEILNRPGRLDEAQFNLIKSHPRVGYDIISGIEFPWPLAEMVVQHHERLDGTGYPQGLKDGDILLESRILAVADVVEAMASHRPYRPALPLKLALDEIVKHKGQWYDPEVVEICLLLFKDENFKWSLEKD